MSTEPHRLRGLIFKWREEAGPACDDFSEYKGGICCSRCEETHGAHTARQKADELEALLEEPELAKA